MAKLYNLARVTTATTGTGTITLGAAVNGYLTFALAGVSNGETVAYGIRDGANSETGTGVYTSAGTTLTRTVTKSTNSDAAINLSGSAEVYITARKEDLLSISETQNANIVFAGPSSGGAAAPTFRSLVGADIPTAVQADQETGTSTTVFVSPGVQHFHPGHPKAWAYTTVSTGTPTLQTSYNITSITDTGVGRLTVTIATDFSSANWVAVMGAVSSSRFNDTVRTPAAGTVELNAYDSADVLADPTAYTFAGFGDQA